MPARHSHAISSRAVTTNHTTFLSAIFNRRSATLSFQEMPAKNTRACHSSPSPGTCVPDIPSRRHIPESMLCEQTETCNQAPHKRCDCPGHLTRESPDDLASKTNSCVYLANVYEASNFPGIDICRAMLVTGVTALSDTQSLPSRGLQV